MTSQQLIKRLGLTIEIPRYYLKAAFTNGFHPVAGGMLMLRALRNGYWPSEAFRIGLLNRDHAAPGGLPQLWRQLRKGVEKETFWGGISPI